ncbi:MAG: acyl-CoA dehydrogenase [Candidatus Hydrogenedentota bacterium]|nr:MAG: acyl-CoA dehydrogenase [Candidatus Hydrogenedentota bacterium]PCJ60480.1 MAG: acyl-CoA dehydrogenase [Candidatus Hydrogenedentota bacterium]
MDLDFTSEQDMLRDSAAKFLANEFNFEMLRGLEESDAGYSPELWNHMAELGWLGLPFPEEVGGFGGTFMDLAIIQEEIGKALLPSPYFSTIVLCGTLILEGGSDDQKTNLIEHISGGELIMALAQYEEDGSYRETGITMAATQSGDGYELSGTKLFVMDANIAQKLIVAARTPDGDVTLFIVDADAQGVSIEKLPTVGKDNTCAVTFAKVGVSGSDVLGAVGGGWALLESMRAKGAVAKAAEMVGGCKTSITMSVEYAKEREQYGKPIGGNQAIQHYLSNMLLGYDSAHSYLYKVVSMIDDGANVEKEAAIMKACVNESFKFITERSVQIHGGVGTSREHNIGLFYRRAKSWETVCGNSDMLYDQIVENLANAYS